MTTPDQAPALTTQGWAEAWLTAFETAAADPVTLMTGERLLTTADIGQVHINPGIAKTTLTAPNAKRPHQPCVTISPLERPAWKRLYTALAASDKIADVINAGRLPDTITDPATVNGIRIAPTPGDITFSCSCRPDPGICAHTAAVGYRVAQNLRANPGLLITLRGGSMKQLRTTVRLRKPTVPAQAPAPQQARAGTDAAQAFDRWKNRPARTEVARRRTPQTAPAPLLDSLRPELPGPGPTVQALRLLTKDAAVRAAALLAGRPLPMTDEPVQDAARLLADPAHRPYLEHAAEQLGLSTLQMRDLALAHEYGGPANVDVTLWPLPADPDDLAHAEAAIQPHRPAPLATLASQDNHLTDATARIQIRLGTDRRWYPYTDWHGTWRPAPGHSADPAVAYRAARRALRDR
ncbi:hypothetical protein OG800_50290 (plasmid) [Streptomyces sp. NBC_00445]|uniref:hypothetical protein n=1 Tax=Streptomyces sp. NBC_00445 TaxID=2975745 RepID=UPI002E1E815B